MKIHREGIKIIPVMIILTVGLYVLFYWMIPFIAIIHMIMAIVTIIFIILVVWFFRDPKVVTPQKEGVIYAPAEGKIVVIERSYEGEYHKEDRIQISIFMSPLNVHVNRSPVRGKVDFFKYHPGKFLVAWHPKSSTNNERTSVGFETENGIKILMRQIAGIVARRIAFYLKVGDSVEQGASVGFIRFGSRVDLFLPLDAEINVQIGDLTKAGETKIAIIK